jgi:hypothetical protein
LDGLGVRPGVDVDVVTRNWDETITLRVGGNNVPLGKPAASRVWAQLLAS